MAHHKRSRSRTAVHRSTKPPFPRGTPAWWGIIFNVRPKRRQEHRLCDAVRAGADPDGLIWPVAGHKPHLWYW